MTALRKYLRLESSGLWRETPETRLREVVVGLRDATLVLSDPKTEAALSQWSLPAVERLNPGTMPALYGVGEDQAETLEIDDPDMAEALDTVRRAIDRRRAKPGRLRGVVLPLGFLALAGLAVFWLPGRLIDYTAAMLPEPTRAELGRAALADLLKITGSPCATKPGKAAIAALQQRLGLPPAAAILVVRDALTQPAHLPGGIILLPATLVETAKSPDAVAGFVLAEGVRAATNDPTRALLRHAGLAETLHILTQGDLAAPALSGVGQVLLAAPTAAVDAETLLATFAGLKISSAAYGYALDDTGETSLTFIEADPARAGSDPAVLDKDDWAALQAICKTP